MIKEIVIECFRSENVVFRISKGSNVRKIFSISFSKADGSLFVNLPYFSETKGLLSIATIPAGQTAGPVDLKPQGKCSSHNVKYAHHLSPQKRRELKILAGIADTTINALMRRAVDLVLAEHKPKPAKRAGRKRTGGKGANGSARSAAR
jgi:hypothetical protein